MPCDPCCIPARNLTVSWVNDQIGGGSTALAWDNGTAWESAPCVNGRLKFRLACVGGSTVFTVTQYTASPCTGTPTAFSGLLLYQQLCTPFLLTYLATTANAPALRAAGYSSFTITQ